MNGVTSFAPILTLSLGSLVYLVTGKLLERTKLAAILAFGLVVAAIAMLGIIPDSIGETEYGLIVNDFSRLLAVLACVGALVSLVSTRAAVEGEGIDTLNEYYFLALTSLSGALVMIFCSDFLSLFIGVEVASLALYCLCGARIHRGVSAESSMKYFLLGCFSSAFLLLGIALWYGATGSLSMVPVAAVPYNAMIFLSFLMMLVGLAFKVGLAPFHFWVPDVYQGAPTSVTTFMSCVVKVAAFAALLKVLVLGFTYPQPWSFGALWVLAVLAMTLGNLAALQQRSIKRMLAYSSVAQAGYMLVGIVSTEFGSDGVAATLFYLVSYCAMTIGSFAALAAVGPDADGVESIHGLGKRSPLLAGCLTVFFLGMAGLPPSMAGLTAKLFVFSEALSAGLYGLAIIAVLNSALACAYYFRIPVAAFFQSAPAQQAQPISVPLTTALALVLCAAAVVLLGLFPEPLLALVRDAADSLVGP